MKVKNKKKIISRDVPGQSRQIALILYLEEEKVLLSLVGLVRLEEFAIKVKVSSYSAQPFETKYPSKIDLPRHINHIIQS